MWRVCVCVCVCVCLRAWVAVREVLGHEAVAEVAVVGMPDETWGERIVAIIRWKDPDKPPSVEDMKEFLGPRLAP
jgi:Acyl-CoA synthetases (AMP-forming)/AMP-acid ligases II